MKRFNFASGGMIESLTGPWVKVSDITSLTEQNERLVNILSLILDSEDCEVDNVLWIQAKEALTSTTLPQYRNDPELVKDADRFRTLLKLTEAESPKKGKYAVTLEYDNSGDAAVIRNGDGRIFAECCCLPEGMYETLPDTDEAEAEAQLRLAVDAAALKLVEGSES